MSGIMTEHDDLDMQIAEFVLGTLPADQRHALHAQREQDPALDARILQWEERLVGMIDDVEPVQPGPELFAQIERALNQQEAQPTQSSHTASVVTLRRQVNLWRWSTAMASAAALVLMAVSQPFPNHKHARILCGCIPARRPATGFHADGGFAKPPAEHSSGNRRSSTRQILPAVD